MEKTVKLALTVLVLSLVTMTSHAQGVPFHGLPAKKLQNITVLGESAKSLMHELRQRKTGVSVVHSDDQKVTRSALFNDVIVCYESAAETFCEIPTANPKDMVHHFGQGTQLTFQGASARNVILALNAAAQDDNNAVVGRKEMRETTTYGTHELTCSKWRKEFYWRQTLLYQSDDKYECLVYAVDRKDIYRGK
jgi:hypothetical protein